jgi:hypothetical protein
MPSPLARAGVTRTGPSTGCLSMPVRLISFHGLGRGRPTLTESTFIRPRYGYVWLCYISLASWYARLALSAQSIRVSRTTVRSE